MSDLPSVLPVADVREYRASRIDSRTSDPVALLSPSYPHRSDKDSPVLRRLRSSPDNLHLGLMLALTFSTGVVDAVGYLGLDRVFTGNMTGNVVILGMALAGADGLPIVGPIIALLSFMLGAVIAGRVLRPVKDGWTARSTGLLTTVAVIMVALAVTLIIYGATPPQPQEYIVTMFLAIGMGMQAGTARHLGVKDVTTVVVTSTITGFAADSRLAGGKGQPWFRRGAAILLIAVGAGVGALLLRLGLGWGVSLTALITVAVAILGHVGASQSRRDATTADAVTPAN